MKRLIKFILIVTITLATAGCFSKTYRDSKANIAQTAQQASQQVAPAVVSKPGYYVDTQSVTFDTQPAWLNRTISLQAHQMPFNLLMGRLLRNSDVVASYDKSVNPQRLVNMQYHGTIKGALDTLASEMNYHYSVHRHDLAWSAFETKTFNISFIPGSSNYLVGQHKNNTTNNAYTGYASYSSPVGQINDQQYSNLEGRLSIWQDLQHTLNQLKSPQGRIMLSESTKTVTVRDHPCNVRAMSRYIVALNKTFSGSNSTNKQQQFEAIQVPTLAQKAFNQRSVVSSGSTLIIAGYKRLRDETDKASFFSIGPSGSKDAATNNVEMLVLITPTILHSSKSNVHINTG